MREYPKIQTVFKRDPATNMKTLLDGQYSEEAFGYLAGNDWVWTEKVDGTNIRIMVGKDLAPMNGGIAFGGKTDDAQIPAFLVTKLAERFYPQADKLHEMFPDGGCLYGEGYGAKIQKGGGNYRPDQDFVLFDVKVGDWWLQRDAVEDVAGKLSLDIVPILGRGTLAEMIEYTRRGFDSLWGKFPAEGIVARPAVELKLRNGGRIITKIKHKDFQPAKVAAA
jgi:hypothetical protein